MIVLMVIAVQFHGLVMDMVTVRNLIILDAIFHAMQMMEVIVLLNKVILMMMAM